MSSDVHVGDIGTVYRGQILDAGQPFDPSAATTSRLIFRTPHGVFERDAIVTTDGTSWFLEYVVTDPAFHCEAGIYRWQGQLVFPDGQRYTTSMASLTVWDTLVSTHGPTLLHLYGSSEPGLLASPDQYLSGTLWYDRPLQLVGDAPVTLAWVSNQPDLLPPLAMTLYHGDDLGDLLDQPDEGYGRGQVMFDATVDLTGCAGLTLTLSTASPRDGFDQLLDKDTGRAVPDSLAPFAVVIRIAPPPVPLVNMP